MSEKLSVSQRMRSYLQLVATGPELSKSLNEAQAEDAMTMILDGEIDAVQTSLFLIALRMKRETEAENIGVLNALTKRMEPYQTSNEQLLVLADPFNGYLRGLAATPFLPAVYAACGLPCYLHGLERVGPKYGITANKVLKAAGYNVDATSEQVKKDLETEKIGWGYVDQKQYIPALHDLVELRDLMVKRSCLSTLEVVLMPIAASQKTHLLTGFVHKAYPPVYAALAKHIGYDSAAIVRGVEGGCIPSLSQVSRYFGYSSSNAMQLNKLTPSDLSIEQQQRAVPIADEYASDISNTTFENTKVLDRVVEHNVEVGMAALANEPGTMLDSLVYGASIGLVHAGITRDLPEAATLARSVIANGAAMICFKEACTSR